MEHYSELEGDLSTMAPEGFQQAYAIILAAAAAHLADPRLMVIITADVRGEDGSLLSCRIKPARHSVALCHAGREHSELPATARFSPSAHDRASLKRAEKWGAHISPSFFERAPRAGPSRHADRGVRCAR